jgi:hypothetical protein
MLAMPAANLVVASRKEMTDTYDRFADRALEQLETPLWKITDEPSFDEELQQLEKQPLSRVRYAFVNLLLPAFDAFRYTYAKSHGEREGVLIGIALELYRREHNKWPASLTELSPRWLPEIPVDRITGKPLKYRIVEDRPIVYSMGADSDDDDGRLPAECNGDPHEFRVSEPYEIPAVTTDHIRNWHDGDWIIWSTQKLRAH